MSSQGTIFFHYVANDVFIVYIFEFFQSYLVVLRQELTVPNTIGVREKSRPTAIRKIDFFNVEFTLDFIP